MAGTRPPNFRQTKSTGRNCGTCRYMGSDGVCTKYDYPVKRNDVCDKWALAAKSAWMPFDQPKWKL